MFLRLFTIKSSAFKKNDQDYGIPRAHNSRFHRYHHFEDAESEYAPASVYSHLPAPVSVSPSWHFESFITASLFAHSPISFALQADLNGDGKPEVLSATPNGVLLVLAPRRPGDGFAPALVLSEIDLRTLVNSRGPVSVMALSTGYITPRPTDLVRALRKQVVVAVTNTGHVVVLDHNLKVMWKQDLNDHMPTDGKLEEVAVLITEHAVNKGDRGLVVIGARAEPDTLADDVEEDDFLEEEIIAEGLERTMEYGRKKEKKLHEVGGDGGASGRHFSYFAFSGDAGHLRWKHEAVDFHRDMAGLQEATVSTQHSLRAAAQLQEGVHYGEASCRDYREAVLSSLPHSWFTSRDTKLHLAHFHRHRAHQGAQKEQLSTLASQRQRSRQPPTQNQPGALSPPLAASVAGKRQAHPPPNVIVAHVEEGIEAVHLFSGRTVCRLYLDPYALHVDLNGDGIPDHVHAIGGDAAMLAQQAAEEDADEARAHRRHKYCSAVVTSGIPPKMPLFNGTICRPMRFGLRRARKLGFIDVAPPAALPVPGRGGHYRQQVLRQKTNAVFLTSRGDLTSYSSSGDLLWQVMSSAFWKPGTIVEQINPDSMDDDSSNEIEAEVIDAEPTLVPMALRRHAIPSVILAAGDHEATLVSEHGHELASFELPEMPIQPLVVTDFNMDGYNDIVVVGREGLYGWAQVRRPGAVPFSALIGVLIVTMLTVFVMQQGFMQTGAKKGRSTDRVD